MTKEQWEAIKQKDARYDNQFVYVNRNTGTICKPSCKKKRVSPERILIFPTVKEAIDAGYHVCKKCHPEYLEWKGARLELADAAIQLIRDHYTEAFSLDQLADSLHINKFYLLRTFRQITGYTPLLYHNMCRCEKARELLQQPELAVSYIAIETGYNSASHFSRKFKEITGVTPLQYRKAYLASLDK